MSELQHLEIDGQPATVAFLKDDVLVEPDEATLVIARFADGRMAYYFPEPVLTAAGGQGSGNFGHAGRPGEVGGSAEGGSWTGRDVEQKLTPGLAAVAQKVYDAWDENEDEYAGGGICHLIADEMVQELDAKGIEASTVSALQGEQHVWVVAKLADGVYNIDIPPHQYETGGGYNWKKIPGVTLDRNSVVVDRITADPSKYDEYTEEG